MKKVPLISTSVVSGVVLAVSLSSPAFAQYQYASSQPSTSNYSSHSSHEENEHQDESKDKQKHDSSNQHDQYDNKQSTNETKNETENEHQDCHIKDNSGNQDNYAKYPDRPNCKTVAKTTASSTVPSASAKSEQGKSDQALPETLPNTGAGNIALIGAVVTAAGYAANLLRLKFRVQQ